MAKMYIKASDEYAKKLSKLKGNTDKISEKAIYNGAGIVADAIKDSIKGLPVNNQYGTESDPIRGVSSRQKADLIDGFGVAPMRKEANGDVNTKLGFGGYGRTPTKKYPKGVPNQLLARSVESGTTFRVKTPFVRPAVRKAKADAIQEMDRTIETEIKKIDL